MNFERSEISNNQKQYRLFTRQMYMRNLKIIWS